MQRVSGYSPINTANRKTSETTPLLQKTTITPTPQEVLTREPASRGLCQTVTDCLSSLAKCFSCCCSATPEENAQVELPTRNECLDEPAIMGTATADVEMKGEPDVRKKTLETTLGKASPQPFYTVTTGRGFRNLPGLINLDINLTSVKAVAQKTFENVNITHEDYKPLYTIGLGPCVAIGIFNPATGIACLAHFDSGTNITQMLGEMRSTIRPGECKSFIARGNEKTGKNIRDQVKEQLRTPDSNVVATSGHSASTQLNGAAINVLFDPKTNSVAFILSFSNQVLKKLHI